jgi:hypothetical protein
MWHLRFLRVRAPESGCCSAHLHCSADYHNERGAAMTEPTLTDEECDILWAASEYAFSGKELTAEWYRKVIRVAFAAGRKRQRQRDANVAANHICHHRDSNLCAVAIAAAIEEPDADTD